MARGKKPPANKISREAVQSAKRYVRKVAKANKRNARQTDDYLSSARNLFNIIPSLKKYRKRKTLKGAEKSAITRAEKKIKNVPDLIPVTKKQARRLGRKKLFAPGVRAIQLRGITPKSKTRIPGVSHKNKIRISKDGSISVVQEEGRWIYWPLSRETVKSKRGMKSAGAAAFEKRFPIEIVADLTREAFAKYDVQQVHLWAHAGIVGDGFQDLPSFIRWVNMKWNAGRYMGTQENENTGKIYSNPSDPGKWVNGIAILVENPEYTKRRRELERASKKAQN